jgi:hypothetical protein
MWLCDASRSAHLHRTNVFSAQRECIFARAMTPRAANLAPENNFALDACAEPLNGVFGRKTNESAASDSAVADCPATAAPLSSTATREIFAAV